MEVPLKDLYLDKKVQMRCALNRMAIIDYAEAYERGEHLPDPIVFWIPGQKKYVGDGFHRVLAAKRSGKKSLRCLIRSGTLRDAILFAAGANRDHGVRRTPEDKRKCVITFLCDKEWGKWTDTVIARHAGVGSAMVSRYRDYLGSKVETPVGVNGAQQRVFTNAKGEQRIISVSPKERDLEVKVRGEKCPYCGQKMPKGHGPRPRGMKSHARSAN